MKFVQGHIAQKHGVQQHRALSQASQKLILWPTGYPSVLLPIPHCLNDCDSLVLLEAEKGLLSSFVFLFKYCVDYSKLLTSPNKL